MLILLYLFLLLLFIGFCLQDVRDEDIWVVALVSID